MKKITYNDIYIWYIDEKYIDRIANETGVEETEAILYSLESDRPCIANDIICHIISTAVWNLSVSEKSKEILYDRIYISSIDSWFINTDLEDFPKRERKKIREFMAIFSWI